ncbi:MAG: hypothetical protein JSS07_01010 [Proteobacteria bacterium]|nr:hypothetical protein [Pseudomonadota bacterium]
MKIDIAILDKKKIDITFLQEDIDKINEDDESFLKAVKELLAKDIHSITLNNLQFVNFEKLMSALKDFKFHSLHIISDSFNDDAALALGNNLTKPKNFVELRICIKKHGSRQATESSVLTPPQKDAITALGAQILGQGVKKANLQSLILQSCLKGGLPTAIALVKELEGDLNLLTLNLSNNALFLKKIIIENPDDSLSTHYSDNDIQDIVNFSNAIANTQIEDLNLDENAMICSDVPHFTEKLAFATLKTLRLNYNFIGNRGFKMLISACNTLDLTKLELSSNRISSIKEAPFHQSQLQYINIEDNFLDDNEYANFLCVIPHTSLCDIDTSTYGMWPITNYIYFKSALQVNAKKVEAEFIHFNKSVLEFYLCANDIAYPLDLTLTIAKTYINAFNPAKNRALQNKGQLNNDKNTDELSFKSLFQFMKL